MTIEEAIEHYGLGSVRTFKRRMAETGLPERERTKDGKLTEQGLLELQRVMDLRAGKASSAPSQPAPKRALRKAAENPIAEPAPSMPAPAAFSVPPDAPAVSPQELVPPSAPAVSPAEPEQTAGASAVTVSSEETVPAIMQAVSPEPAPAVLCAAPAPMPELSPRFARPFVTELPAGILEQHQQIEELRGQVARIPELEAEVERLRHYIEQSDGVLGSVVKTVDALQQRLDALPSPAPVQPQAASPRSGVLARLWGRARAWANEGARPAQEPDLSPQPSQYDEEVRHKPVIYYSSSLRGYVTEDLG